MSAQPVKLCPTCGSRRRCAHRRGAGAPGKPRDYRGLAEYRRTRLAVLERDGYVCHLCNRGPAQDDPADTIDHTPTPYAALPRDGAGNVPLELALDEDNLKAAHARCNRVQSDTHREEL